jgi:hypothetical protein
MQIDDDKAERMGASLEALNARIARLAMALDVPLDSAAAQDALMASAPVQVAFERRQVASGSTVVQVSSERRVSHKRNELRGLLALRYHLEAVSVNENGLLLTRQVLVEAQAHLVRQGFKPGADGLDLDDLFIAP